MKYAVSAIAVLALVGCTDAQTATRVLNAQGYKDVQITGFRYFGCGEQDQYRTGFKATGPGGQQVEGVVCSGFSFFGKSSTVRID